MRPVGAIHSAEVIRDNHSFIYFVAHTAGNVLYFVPVSGRYCQSSCCFLRTVADGMSFCVLFLDLQYENNIWVKGNNELGQTGGCRCLDFRMLCNKQ